ncbi:MAG: J domain-containing protein [Desulfobacterales bacterium]|nr:MAG: J domain-containing protein [Desulfobacterales bacterium]
MYLAAKKINGQVHYFIRESYRQAEHFLSRDLFDLGPDPTRYIIYPGGNAFYIDEVIEDRLSELETDVTPDELEDIFWRFVRPEIKRVLEPFRLRQDRHRANRRKKLPAEKVETPLHIFDKRRVHFLKFGRADQRFIERLPQKMFRVLFNKSRDEIEQGFMDMEAALVPREYKTYTYTIFNLQQFFYESYSKNHPEMLSQEKVDAHFIKQICRLNTDRNFWGGMKTGDRLHDYLIRYVLMHFDYDYAASSFMEDYLRQFINSRRDYRPPFKSTALTLKNASAIFGESKEALKKMSRKELARLYRRKAQQLHPDKGGNHKKFIKLTEAYHALLKTRK